MLTSGSRKGGGGGDEPTWDLTRERKAARWPGNGERWRRLKWLGEGSALSEGDEWRVEVRAVSFGRVARPFFRAGEGAGAAAGGGGVNAGRFGIETKKGGSGEGRRFNGGRQVVGAPTMEEEGGRRGCRDGSVRRCPTGVAAQSYLTGGRRRPAEPSRLKGFLGRSVLLIRADRGDQIKSFSNFFYLNSGIWKTLKMCTRIFWRNFDMGIFSKIF
jgi:hypothetical protein